MLLPNPWVHLDASAPFVLPEDRALVERFNARASEAHGLRLDVLPEPFVGRPDAPVVLLALNPGYSDEDPALHAVPSFAARLRANLAHEPQPYPFYFLNPSNEGSGRRWWRRKLKALLDEFPEVRVAEALLCVEYFPYHSRIYKSSAPLLPSQEYGFELVRSAVARGAVVVAMRARRVWCAAIPQLELPGRLLSLRNPQNVAVSLRNCPDGFERIRSAVAAV